MDKVSKLRIAFIGFIFLSCGGDNVDCSSALPGPNWFELGIFDTEGQPLIGSVYEQETFRVFNASDEVFLSRSPSGDSTRIQVRFPDFDPDVDYYIELSSTDVDTLRLRFDAIQGPCFLNYEMQQLIYNGETVKTDNSGKVDLIK